VTGRDAVGVIVCPKCGSRDVGWDLSLQAYARGSIFNQRRCISCGFSGIFFPEVDEDSL